MHTHLITYISFAQNDAMHPSYVYFVKCSLCLAVSYVQSVTQQYESRTA